MSNRTSRTCSDCLHDRGVYNPGLNGEVDIGPLHRGDSNFLAENSRGPAAAVYPYNMHTGVAAPTPPSTYAPPPAGHTAGFNYHHTMPIVTTNPPQWQFADTTAATPSGMRWLPDGGTYHRYPAYFLPQGAGEASGNLPPFPASHPGGYQGHPSQLDGPIMSGHYPYAYVSPPIADSGSASVNQIPAMPSRQPTSHTTRYAPYVQRRHQNAAPETRIGNQPPPVVQPPVVETGSDAIGRTMLGRRGPDPAQALTDPPQIIEIPAIVAEPNDSATTGNEAASVSKARSNLDRVHKYLI